MMKAYNPLQNPDPQEWLAIDEAEQQILIQDFHKRYGIKMPNLHVHAAIHAAVENQIAMGDETPAADTLKRLMDEGLDRHDSVHAIGCVLTEHIQEILKMADSDAEDNPNKGYFRKLKSLTAKKWHDEYGD